MAHLDGRPVDHLPLMPITMMFACDQIGAHYRDYCTDHRVLVEGQLRTAENFGFDYVNTMSDPALERPIAARLSSTLTSSRWR